MRTKCYDLSIFAHKFYYFYKKQTVTKRVIIPVLLLVFEYFQKLSDITGHLSEPNFLASMIKFFFLMSEITVQMSMQ